MLEELKTKEPTPQIKKPGFTEDFNDPIAKITGSSTQFSKDFNDPNTTLSPPQTQFKYIKSTSGQPSYQTAVGNVPSGFVEVNFGEYTQGLKDFTIQQGDLQSYSGAIAGESMFSFLQRTDPSKTTSGALSGYIINPTTGNIQQQSSFDEEQALQTKLASGNYINIGTASAPLLVPKGSAAAQNIASPTDVTKTQPTTTIEEKIPTFEERQELAKMTPEEIEAFKKRTGITNIFQIAGQPITTDEFVGREGQPIDPSKLTNISPTLDDGSPNPDFINYLKEQGITKVEDTGVGVDLTKEEGAPAVQKSEQMNAMQIRVQKSFDKAPQGGDTPANKDFIQGVAQAKRGTPATAEELKSLEGKTLNEVINAFGLSIDGAVDTTKGTGINAGSLIRDPEQLKQLTESDIARTTSGNIYRRDLAKEQEALDDFISKFGKPVTTEDWNKFHDFVYEPGGVSEDLTTSVGVDTGVTEPVAGDGTAGTGEPNPILDAYDKLIAQKEEDIGDEKDIDPILAKKNEADRVLEIAREVIVDKKLIDAVILEGISKDQPIPMALIRRQQAQYTADQYIENLMNVQDYNNKLILSNIAGGDLLEAQRINQGIASDRFQLETLMIDRMVAEDRIERQEADDLYRLSEYELDMADRGYTSLDAQSYETAKEQFGLSRLYQSPVNQKWYLKPEPETGEADLVESFIKKYPDAGILPTDDIITAGEKLKGSKIYQKSIRIAGGGSGSPSVKGFKFSSDDTGRMLAVGFTQADLPKIESDINEFGVPATVEGMLPEQAEIIQNIARGTTPTQELKEPTISEAKRKVIGGVEALMLDNASMEEIEEYIKLKGYTKEDLADTLAGYTPTAVSTKKWWEFWK